jgi:beta-lactam-binding protein with PASTA domain
MPRPSRPTVAIPARRVRLIVAPWRHTEGVPVVPDLTGRLPSDAFAALRDIGLQPVLIGLPTAKFDGYSAYRVAGQEPSPGAEVDAGTRVALAHEYSVEAFGPLERPPFAAQGSPAPDAVGMPLEAAMARVTDAGFIAVVFQPKRGIDELAVSRQEPEAGEAVNGFREICLWLD